MSTKVVTTDLVRFSYAYVFNPKANEDGGKLKYSVSIIIPKTATGTIAKINAAVEVAKKEGVGKWGGKLPVGLKMPLRDGDLERPGDPVYEGCYFLNASSVQKPGVVDANMNPIIDPEEFYSGCWGRVALNFYAFNAEGKNKGVAAGLQNLQKVRDGERLSGNGSSPEQDFAEFAGAGAYDDLM